MDGRPKGGTKESETKECYGTGQVSPRGINRTRFSPPFPGRHCEAKHRLYVMTYPSLRFILLQRIICMLNVSMKKRRVHSLTGRITLDTLFKAFKAVKRNRGAAGIDKQSIKMFETNLEGPHAGSKVWYLPTVAVAARVYTKGRWEIPSIRYPCCSLPGGSRDDSFVVESNLRIAISR